MKKRILSLFCLIALISGIGYACTSAIIGADMNPSGRPLLWKNRDTGVADNKIEYIPENQDEFSYVALFNSPDTLLKEAWMGMNEYGFAIMNTASYNLKDDEVLPNQMDKEGLIMTIALKKCKNINDFKNILDSLPKPLGVEANFGVIDAYGNGGYFETNNYKYTFYDLKDSPDHVLIRTNYSYSGRPEEGFGFIREGNAKHLLQPYIDSKSISPEVFTEGLSRSFYHDLLKRDMAQSGERWIIDQDFIPRFTTSASVVIEGCKPLAREEKINPDTIKNQYIMWSALGYPPCAEVFPVYCCPDGVDDSLKGNNENGRSQQCDIVNLRKAEVFPFKKGNGNKYIDMHKLFDKQTGYNIALRAKNLETYKKAREARDN